MGAIFTTLFAKIAAVIKWFSDLFVAVFVALYDLLKDGASWCFEQVLDVAIDAVSGIDVSGISAAGGWGSLPAEVVNILALIGVGEAIAIITAAIGIRLVLQLVPFTRLGS
jgi:hypothetical protein